MSDNSSLAAILARIDAKQLDDDDHALLAALLEVQALLEKCFADFEFAAATQGLYTFFYSDFCDWYVEVAKARLADPAARDHVLAVQDLVIRQFLLLFEPFAPFITEELWTLLGYNAPGARFLQDARIGTAEDLRGALAERNVHLDTAAAGRVAKLKATVTLARQLKADKAVAQKRDVLFSVVADDATWTALDSASAKFTRLAGAASLARAASAPALPAIVTPLGTLYLDTGVKVDAAAERARLTKELEAVKKHIAGTEARLGNEAFTSKAPPAVLEGARKQLADQQAKRAELERLLAALG